jgi:hypothetical protein
MRDRQKYGFIAAGFAGVIAATTFLIPPAGADGVNPSQAEALAGLETARIYISQHPDTTLPPVTESPTTAAPTTVPPTSAPPTTTVPATTPPPTTTVPPTTVPPTTLPPASAFVSGLGWNSGVWAAHDADRATSFGPWRNGKPIDNVGAFVGYEAWTNMSSNWWASVVPTGFNSAKQDLSLGVPVWPNDGAVGTDAQWSNLANQIKAVDPNAFVRLGWEMNLPGVHGLTSGNYTAWTNQYQRILTLMLAQAPNLRFVWNPNAGQDQTSGCGNSDPAQWCSRRAFQLVKARIYSFAIDEYDWYPAATNAAGWESHKTTVGHLDESYAYAVANGKKFSIPEWGIACTSSNSGCGGNGVASGGDDANYVNQMIGWVNTRKANIGYESYFDEPALYIHSNLRTYDGVNPLGPNAPAAYKNSLTALTS